jgi:cell division transport system permease protein
LIQQLGQRLALSRRLGAWGSLHLQCAVSSLGALWRTRWGTALTAAVIGVALALPMLAFLVVHSIAGISDRVDLDAQVSLFLRPELSNQRARLLADEFAARRDVLTARVITKEQGLAEFRKAAGLAGVLKNLSHDNPLPAVIMLSVADSDSAQLTGLAEAMTRHEAVEFVQMDRDWIQRLEAVLELARQFLWIVSTLLGGGVMLVIGNTLRLSIESRRTEIEIVKLFGASDSFVRRPFLYHGVYFGVIGAAAACVLVTGAALALHSPIARLGSLYTGELTFTGPGLDHFAVLLVGGAVLGLLGAWLSVAHHLHAIEPH